MPKVVELKDAKAVQPASRKRSHLEAFGDDEEGMEGEDQRQGRSDMVRHLEKKTRLCLNLDRDALDTIRHHNLKVPPKQLARIEGRPSKRLTISLYRQAVMILKRVSGITLNTARYIRYLRNLNWEPMSLYRKEIEQFNRERGIVWWQIRSIDKVSTASVKYVPLLGHLEGGKTTIISMAWIPSNEVNTKAMGIFLKSLFGDPK